MTESCADCRTPRHLTELLIVRNVRRGTVRYVCRPDADPRCFASVGPASVESIATASPAAERAGLAAWPESRINMKETP